MGGGFQGPYRGGAKHQAVPHIGAKVVVDEVAQSCVQIQTWRGTIKGLRGGPCPAPQPPTAPHLPPKR